MSNSLTAALAGTLLLSLGSTCHASLEEVTSALASGDSQSALGQFESLPKSERVSFHGRLLEASVLAALGREEEAEQRYLALIDEVPQRPEPYNNLAVLYANQGELDKALGLLEQAIQTNASYATVRDNLSRIYLEKSLNSYAKALRIEQREKIPRLQALYKPSSVPSPSAPLQAAKAAPASPTGSAEVHVPTVVAVAEPAGAPLAREPADATRLSPPVSTEVAVPTIVAEAEPAATSPDEKVTPASETTPVPHLMAEAEKPAVAVVAEPASLPAAAPAVEVTGGESEPLPREAVIQAVQQWAQAWQGQDVDNYLAAYASDFEPTRGLSRAQWVAQRQRRLSHPEQIEVTLDDIRVTFADASHARVEFVQRYRSDHYRDKTRKRLSLAEHAGQWQIRKEITLEVLP